MSVVSGRRCTYGNIIIIIIIIYKKLCANKIATVAVFRCILYIISCVEHIYNEFEDEVVHFII